MTDVAQPNTALSPEWDHWFDEAFTDLIAGDEDLVRAEFDALITAAWPAPPAPSQATTTHTPAVEPPAARPPDTP